jgi:hypothetical protein
LLFALSIAISGVLSVDAADAESTSATPESPPETAPAPRFRVRVEAPSPIKEALERGVGLVRWQHYAEMTDDLLDRLAREAVGEARDIAAAEGFFSAAIDVVIDRSAEPAMVTLRVDAGPSTRITSVRIGVTGPAATDAPLGTDAIAKLEREWLLPEGETFRQSAWLAAKERALATLTASPYAAARIEKSEAAIDPATQSAELDVELASGPAFRFGDLEISGLVKYDRSLVRNYRTIAVGEPYSQIALERYVRRLNASGYFASVQAKIDPDTTHPDDATVLIAVIEAPTKRFEGGLGYSTDVQFRANASYRDVNIDDRGLHSPMRAPRRKSSPARCTSRDHRTTPDGLQRSTVAPSGPTSRTWSRGQPMAARAGARSRRTTSARCPRRTTTTSSTHRARRRRLRTRCTPNTNATGAASTIWSRRRSAGWQACAGAAASRGFRPALSGVSRGASPGGFPSLAGTS